MNHILSNWLIRAPPSSRSSSSPRSYRNRRNPSTVSSRRDKLLLLRERRPPLGVCNPIPARLFFSCIKVSRISLPLTLCICRNIASTVIIFHLLTNRDKLAKLYAELVKLMPDPEKILPPTSVEHLPYLICLSLRSSSIYTIT